MVSYLPLSSLSSSRVQWQGLPKTTFSLEAATESLEAFAYWPQQDMLMVSKPDLGIVACKARFEA